MSDLYWILILGGLHDFFVACMIISIGVFLSFFIITIAAGAKRKEDVREKSLNILAASSIVVILCALLTIMIPSKKELYVIYGVGGTIEYLKSNPNAKELPDKCIKALERWADSVNEENNKDSE